MRRIKAGHDSIDPSVRHLSGQGLDAFSPASQTTMGDDRRASDKARKDGGEHHSPVSGRRAPNQQGGRNPANDDHAPQGEVNHKKRRKGALHGLFPDQGRRQARGSGGIAPRAKDLQDVENHRDRPAGAPLEGKYRRLLQK